MEWKQVPHLFANGKFKIKVDGHIQTFTLTAYHLFHFRYEIEKDSCQLLARPISDMTDEELWVVVDKHWSGERGKDYSDSSEFLDELRFSGLDWIAKSERWDVKIHLLSIGCYPFDQSHFGKTVININEVDNG